MSVILPTKYSYAFSMGQLPAQEILTFDEALNLKDYLTAFLIAQEGPLIDSMPQKSRIYKIITKNDEYEIVLRMAQTFREDADKDIFLTVIASEYVLVENRKRVFDLFQLVTDLDCKKSIALKLYKMVPCEEDKEAIFDILKVYDEIDEFEKGLKIVSKFSNPNLDSILFEFGLDLIYYSKWNECTLILCKLNNNKKQFENLLNNAKQDAALFRKKILINRRA